MPAPKKRNKVDALYYLPPRLAWRIARHAVRVTANQPGPLMLVLRGPPGTGKTCAVTGALAQLGAAVFTVDASLLESPEAGGPVRLVRGLYRQAVAVRLGKGPAHGPNGQPRPAALVIDDIDLGIGRFGELTQMTVNTQHLISYIMALCDRRQPPRIPIFATCNDASALHAPLIRSGRAEILPWELSLEERKEMVRRIFAHLEEVALDALMDWFPNEPIAFFADLKRIWRDEQARLSMARTGATEAIRLALQGQWNVGGRMPSIDQLLSLGERAQAMRRGIFQENGNGED